MRILVSAASKHGATTEIARTIANVLDSAGIETDVRRPEDVGSVTQYDAIVLGSGVYAGHWLGPAKALAERESIGLSSRPVWLFSSGPLGDPAIPEGEPADVAAILTTTAALEHRVFPGRLDRSKLGLAERAIVAVVHAAEGDFRPWPAIRDWASGIARTMQAGSSTS